MGSIWLSYSGYSQYKRCPKQYYLQRVKKEEPPVEESKHNAIVGSVVQRVFEDFYNKELWRRGSKTSEILLELADTYYWEHLDQNYVDFSLPQCRFNNANEPLEEILEIIPKVLMGIKREKLLGPYAKSEVNLKVRFGADDFLHGYLDFVIQKGEGDEETFLIIDGKASKHREKYVDVLQLHYYALMFFLRYRKLPHRLAFLFYRFADDPDKAMDWYDVDKNALRSLRIDLEDTLYEIKKRRFEATPSSSACKYCPWASVCSERLGQVAEKRRKKAKKNPSSIDLKGKGSAKIGF